MFSLPYRETGNAPLTETPLISIVDDDELSRVAIGDFVASLGFSARTFGSAEAFLESSSVGETRCLILDVQMPKMSGFELQEHLSQSGVDLPIIFITAFSDAGAKTRALKAGAICFLDKPAGLRGPQLVDCLRTALSRGEGFASRA
jgi:FixJ family two-component response regulator